jgi:hypothetical protein
MICKTVGDLQKMLAELPPDMPIGGYDGRDSLDYREVSFYTHDRSNEKDWKDRQTPEMIEWWNGNPPPIVFVCNTD